MSERAVHHICLCLWKLKLVYGDMLKIFRSALEGGGLAVVMDFVFWAPWYKQRACVFVYNKKTADASSTQSVPPLGYPSSCIIIIATYWYRSVERTLFALSKIRDPVWASQQKYLFLFSTMMFV